MTNKAHPIDNTRPPRTDSVLTVAWLEQRIRPGLMIEEDDGVLRPLGMYEASLLISASKGGVCENSDR